MHNQQQWAIGLMSGTSLDGIDIALIQTDGITVQTTEFGMTYPYSLAFKEKLKSILGSQKVTPVIKEIEDDLTHLHATAVQAFLDQFPSLPSIQLIGFHGQTIFHRPRTASALAETWQLGDGELLSRLTGIDVVYDFRTHDVKAGGEGAPLVPLYHQALSIDLPKPLVVINIGGVANLTFMGTHDELLAFDTGPGGALLDDWMLQKTGNACDTHGTLAASGTADHTIANQWLQHPYFKQPFPKSLDRNTFSKCLEDIENFTPENGAATLTDFTVKSMILAIHQLPMNPTQVLLTGGGRRNRYLQNCLSDALSCPIDWVESVGWNGDLLEAQAFAFLAVRVLRGMPTSLPLTTGVLQPTCGGRYVKAMQRNIREIPVGQ